MSAPSAFSLAKATGSPAQFDSIGDMAQSVNAADAAPPLSGFEAVPSFELASPLAPSGLKSAQQVEQLRRKEGYARWGFKLDLEAPVVNPRHDETAYRIIAVSCRLFVKVTKVYEKSDPSRYTWVIEEAPYELIPTALKHLADGCDDFKVPYFHIGWIDTYIDISDRHELSSILINRHRCVPVYLERDEVEGFYSGFCKGVLWPLLHYSLRTKNFSKKFNHFAMYEKVNERFADAVMKIYRKGDVIWIHDYHLLLTSRRIRQTLPHATIGYFMHSPFPTVELFRQLPVRRVLLEGMLAADVVGFNTYSHCNHHRAACEALLSIDTQGKGMTTADGRFVRTHISPAGINFSEIRNIVTSPEVQARVSARRSDASLRGLKIVVGRSRKLDDAQGTLLRLQAFEEFLKQHKEWRGKTVLLEVVDQHAQTADTELQALVQETVGNINGLYGELGRSPPVHLVQPRESSAFSMQESCEYYMLANVLMVTPLRDGLSLASHEAVACQGDFEGADGTTWKGNKAPLILSEFAGASAALGGSIIVNPHDVHQVACELKRALEMTETECAEAHQHNLEYVSRNTAAFWAESCLRELIAIGHNRVGGATLRTSDSAVAGKIRAEYVEAQERLLLLDWDGSVVPLLSHREAVLPKDVEEILTALTEDPCNHVYVMTGRKREDMQLLFPHLERLGLICEHGAYVRPCGEKSFTTLCGKQGWLGSVTDLLSDYQDRTPGSVTEVKDASVTWHWRNADHDFASWTEKDLLVQLHQRMASQPFTCFAGRRCVEVHPRGVTKVTGVQWLLDHRVPNIDFVLAFGDDRCDEDLFEFIQQGSGEVDSAEVTSTPPLGISASMAPELGDNIRGSMGRAELASSGEQTPGELRKALRRSRTGGSGIAVGIPWDAKRWTVKVGPLSAKTYASASVQSQKDALEILAKVAAPPGWAGVHSPPVLSPDPNFPRSRNASATGLEFFKPPGLDESVPSVRSQ